MTPKPTFCLLQNWMALGGADRCGLDLIRLFKTLGWETVVVATNHQPKKHTRRAEFAEVADVVVCDSNFQEALKHYRPEIVLLNNCHEAYANLGSIKQAVPHCKLVCLMHMILPPPWDFENRLAHSDIDLVLTVSNKLANQLRKLLNDKYGETRIEPLHWYGFRPDQLPIARVKSPTNILCPMRLDFQKRPEFLAEIASILQYSEPNVKFVVAGEGRLKSSLVALARQLRVLDAFQFVGDVPFNYMVELYKEAACVVVPSRDEGIPLAYYEALQLGIPLAVSNVGAVSEIVPSRFLIDFDCHNEPWQYVAAIKRALTGQDLVGEAGSQYTYERWKNRALDLLGVEPFVPLELLPVMAGVDASQSYLAERLIQEIERPSAISHQVGGSHYKEMAIGPAEYCHKNKIGPLEAQAIQYLSRHSRKGGREDLEKAKHSIDLLIELEYNHEKK